ncbi:MAG: hypothetical protein KA761_00280 [Gemmatimonadaceae bacterium]|nr:hypothetical protein [Gemmatimonadaceae bacterium]
MHAFDAGRAFRLFVLLAAALFMAAASEAHAQTSSQWSQLVAYVGKLANRMLDQQAEIERLKAENEQQRKHINDTRVYLVDWTCKWNGFVKQVSTMTTTGVLQPIPFYEGVACGETDPVKFPGPLLPPALPAPSGSP